MSLVLAGAPHAGTHNGMYSAVRCKKHFHVSYIRSRFLSWAYTHTHSLYTIIFSGERSELRESD